MPVYVKQHWTEAFTSKLTNVVKLVGATINCGGAYGRPPVPHVQSYVVATDRVGLQVRHGQGWEDSVHSWKLALCDSPAILCGAVAG